MSSDVIDGAFAGSVRADGWPCEAQPVASPMTSATDSAACGKDEGMSVAPELHVKESRRRTGCPALLVEQAVFSHQRARVALVNVPSHASSVAPERHARVRP